MWLGGTGRLLVASESSVPPYLLKLENSNITRATETLRKDVLRYITEQSPLPSTLELSNE